VVLVTHDHRRQRPVPLITLEHPHLLEAPSRARGHVPTRGWGVERIRG
jgi:hypothetical protein